MEKKKRNLLFEKLGNSAKKFLSKVSTSIRQFKVKVPQNPLPKKEKKIFNPALIRTGKIIGGIIIGAAILFALPAIASFAIPTLAGCIVAGSVGLGAWKLSSNLTARNEKIEQQNLLYDLSKSLQKDAPQLARVDREQTKGKTIAQIKEIQVTNSDKEQSQNKHRRHSIG